MHRLANTVVLMLIAGVSIAHAQDETKSASETKAPADGSAAKKPASNAKKKKKEEPPPPDPIELQQYDVRVTVSFADAPEVNQAFRRETLNAIERVISRTYGRMWKLSLVEDSWVYPPSAEGLRRFTQQQMLDRFEPKLEEEEKKDEEKQDEAKKEEDGNTGQDESGGEGDKETQTATKDEQQGGSRDGGNADDKGVPVDVKDKVLAITIGVRGAAWVVAAREWDRKSRTLSAVETGQTFRSDAVAEVAGELLRTAFRPHLELHKADFNKLELRLQAGEYPAPDPAAAQVRVGDIIIPYFRYRDRKKKDVIKKLQVLPLSYVVVREVKRGRVKGVYLTGVGAGFGGRARGIDQWGFRQRPRATESQVRLVLQTNPDKPLLCQRVEVVAKLEIRDPTDGEPLKIISDRYGMVTLSVRDDYPTLWLYVYSGKELLARVPYAPGLRKLETVELPDDSVRLSVEGEIELIKGRLIDNVAQRAVHMATAKKRAKENKWDEAQAELEKMNQLPGLEEFTSQLTTIRVPAIKKAQEMRSRAAENRVGKLCDEIASVLTTFFNPERAEKFRDELEQIRQTAALEATEDE